MRYRHGNISHGRNWQWKVGRVRVAFSTTIFFSPAHGPKAWPWWKVFAVHVARHGQYSEDTRKQYGCNVWVYTRWMALQPLELSVKRRTPIAADR